MSIGTVDVVFKRYGRTLKSEPAHLFPTTTYGSLLKLWKDEFPFGLKCVDANNVRIPPEGVPKPGETVVAIASDKSERLRAAAEQAAQSYEEMVGLGRKRKREGDQYQSRWQILAGPPGGVSHDGRFHHAPEPNHYWVLWRQSFGPLEVSLAKLLFDPDPQKFERFLCGPAGTGKSHFVLALVPQLMWRADKAAEEAKAQGSQEKPHRVAPVLDCRDLTKDFTRAVVQGLAIGYGNDKKALDELCQLEKVEEFKGFVEKYSKATLWVLDQAQYVEFDKDLKERVDMLTSGQRVLFVTSAGGDEVKAHVIKAHPYADRIRLPAALSEVSAQSRGGTMAWT